MTGNEQLDLSALLQELASVQDEIDTAQKIKDIIEEALLDNSDYQDFLCQQRTIKMKKDAVAGLRMQIVDICAEKHLADSTRRPHPLVLTIVKDKPYYDTEKVMEWIKELQLEGMFFTLNKAAFEKEALKLRDTHAALDFVDWGVVYSVRLPRNLSEKLADLSNSND